MKQKAYDDDFGENEWNFDNVPDSELVACCYWEYARESVFIRDVKRRCIDPRCREMVNRDLWEYVGFDIERIQSLEHISNVFLRGFFFDDDADLKPRRPSAPAIYGSSPRLWQTLLKQERKERAHIRSEREAIPLNPFNWSDGFQAQTISDNWKARQKKWIAYREDVFRQNPGVPEAKLIEEGKLNFEISRRPSIFFVGGLEIGLFEIHWNHFTNEELRDGFYRWVKHYRPNHMPGPDGRGRKTISWRVALEHLGILRLLHYFTLEEMTVLCPKGWKRYATPNRRWLNDAKKARKRFRNLLPFLKPEDEPMSWPPKGAEVLQ